MQPLLFILFLWHYLGVCLAASENAWRIRSGSYLKCQTTDWGYLGYSNSSCTSSEPTLKYFGTSPILKGWTMAPIVHSNNSGDGGYVYTIQAYAPPSAAVSCQGYLSPAQQAECLDTGVALIEGAIDPSTWTIEPVNDSSAAKKRNTFYIVAQDKGGSSSTSTSCKKYLGVASACGPPALVLYSQPTTNLTDWQLIPYTGNTPPTIQSVTAACTPGAILFKITAPTEDPKPLGYQVVWEGTPRVQDCTNMTSVPGSTRTVTCKVRGVESCNSARFRVKGLRGGAEGFVVETPLSESKTYTTGGCGSAKWKLQLASPRSCLGKKEYLTLGGSGCTPILTTTFKGTTTWSVNVTDQAWKYSSNSPAAFQGYKTTIQAQPTTTCAKNGYLSVKGTCSVAAAGTDSTAKYQWRIQSKQQVTNGVLNTAYTIYAENRATGCRKYLGASSDCTKKSPVVYSTLQPTLTQFRMVPFVGDSSLNITSITIGEPDPFANETSMYRDLAITITVAPPPLGPAVSYYEAYYRRSGTLTWNRTNVYQEYYGQYGAAPIQAKRAIGGWLVKGCTWYDVAVQGVREGVEVLRTRTALSTVRKVKTKGC